jgi:hypothetical protein
MKTALVLLAIAVAGWFAFQAIVGPGGPDLTIQDSEVLLATDDLDVKFARGKSFEETYMLFGGMHVQHPNAVANLSLAGLSMRHARPIARRFPDFDRCASPGAALAKPKVASLDMVPRDGETLDVLTQSLAEFKQNLESGGDRVCIQLSGENLTLTSAELREMGEDVTDTFRMSEFFLVDSANRVDCKEALEGA